ncbi:MAG: hypothetical protein HOA52_02820 [Flavobacteriales bacterium]|nr:hypothetical protein [Flavobacteriales bacterium]
MKLKQLYWIFFSFVFSCNAQENTTKLNANVFGFCTSNTFTYCDVDDTSFTNKVHKINPQVLRFPGGSLGNFYHYDKQGYGFNFDEINDWHSQKFADRVSSLVSTQQRKGHHHNYINDFIFLAKQNNSKVILVANILTSKDDEIIKIIDRFIAEDIEILGIELGSELSNRAYKKHINSVEDYIQIAQKYSQIIKEEFPKMKVGVVAAPIKENTPKRLLNWNTKLAQQTFYDAIIHHSYFKVVDGEEDAGVMVSEKEVTESKEIQFELYKDRVLDYFNEGFVKEINEYNTIFNNKDIWITEWNLQMTKTTGNTLLQSLFISQYLLELLSNPNLQNIKIATYHNLAGRDVSGSIFKGVKDGFETHSTYYPLTFLSAIFKNDIVKIDKDKFNNIYTYNCLDKNNKLVFSYDVDWEMNHFRLNFKETIKIYGSNNLFDKENQNGALHLKTDLKIKY